MAPSSGRISPEQCGHSVKLSFDEGIAAAFPNASSNFSHREDARQSLFRIVRRIVGQNVCLVYGFKIKAAALSSFLLTIFPLSVLTFGKNGKQFFLQKFVKTFFYFFLFFFYFFLKTF
jgi:hypothetical protein